VNEIEEPVQCELSHGRYYSVITVTAGLVCADHGCSTLRITCLLSRKAMSFATGDQCENWSLPSHGSFRPRREQRWSLRERGSE